MTIHADFFKIVKEACGSAFTAHSPESPDMVFIDGQVKLMKSEHVTSWPVFFKVQFFKTIEAGFALGAHTVVLAFDNYDHVPASKGMTQAKRAKHKIKYECSPECGLPSSMPEDWGAAMANRTFKVKVICKILQETKVWFQEKLQEPAFANRSLILDYRGVPLVLGHDSHIHSFVNSQDWSVSKNEVGRGECDIKAFTWTSASKRLCIFSTDGDYLPLSLLQTTPLKSPCQVVLYRMVTQIETLACRKRKAFEQQDKPAEKQKNKRTYEFVCIFTIAKWLQTNFPSKSVDAITQFCALVALCGCDFTRNLPRLGPRTLWKLRHQMQNTDLTNPCQAVCALSMVYNDLLVKTNVMPVGVVNKRNFFETVSQEKALIAYEKVMGEIHKNQKVSPRIKEQLWTVGCAQAHVLNTVWTMHYWTLLDKAPNPLIQNFGYVCDKQGRTAFAE